MIEGLGPYPAYRSSGWRWVGNYPAHWELRRIKSLFREKDARSGDGVGTLLSLTRARGIVPQAEASARLALAADLSKYKVCEPGDLIMNRMQAWSGMFARSPLHGLISPDYSVFKMTAGAGEVAYFAHLFRTPALVDEFAQRSRGIGSGFNRLYTPDFGAVSVAVPPPSEQRAILRLVDYFDRRIRRYIAAKQKLIALLNEQEQTIIRCAVKRGLDPTNPLKPSGVEWLGEIPEHWRVMKLRHLFRFAKGRRAAELTRDYIGQHPGPFPVYSGQTESDGLMGRIDEFEFDFPDPVVYVTTVGVATTTRLVSGRFSLSQNCALIIPRWPGTDVVFFESAFRPLFDFEKVGISRILQPSLRFMDLNRFHVPVPPAPEQVAIGQMIRDEVGKLEVARNQAQGEISLLREYRTRVIADVVTGKLDVRAAAERLPDADAHEATDEDDEALVADDPSVGEEELKELEP